MNRYLAFISYRHTDRDNALAGRLRRGLENFHAGRKSSLPRVRKVFRDTDELPTSSDLGADIEAALRGSEWLIPLCSEEYVQSRWCMNEIRSYIALGRKNRILPVIVSGTPETAVPEEIRDLPPAADLRGSENPKKAAESCSAALLARMCGDDPDALLARQRRFRLGLLAGGTAVLAAALSAFALYENHTAAVIAENNRKIETATEEARSAREEAVQERNGALLNQAEYTTVTCENLLADDDVDGAVRTALSALPDDLHGEYPVSGSLLGILQTALSIRQASFRSVRSVPLSFRVTGCDRLSGRSDLLTLSGAEITALNWTTGGLSVPGADMAESISHAVSRGLADGYRHVIGVNSGPAGYAVFYDSGKPICTGSQPYTVNGVPFEADNAVHTDNSGSQGLIFAWRGGEDPAAAVFRAEDQEAQTLLQTSGAIVSAAFIDTGRLAAADSSGTLAVYSAADGSVLYTAETACCFVQYYYYGSGPRLYTVTAEGGLCRLEAGTGRIDWAASLPSPATSLDCNRDSRLLLAVCGDGVRLCSMLDGSVKETLPGTEGALLAQWDSESDGSRFAVVFEDRAEIYEYSRDAEEGLTTGILLSHPDAPYGAPLCYSPDGRYLYLQQSGDISKWDAETGGFLWVNRSGWGDYTGDLTATRANVAGDAFWRQTYSGKGLEKIDAESGETLYSAEGIAGSYFPMPQESPDRKLGLIITNKYSHEMVVFETETGTVFWRRDLYETDRPSAYTAAFTEDSGQVWLMLWLYNQDGFTRSQILRRYSAEDGKLLQEDRISGENDPLALQYSALPKGVPETAKPRFTFCGMPARVSGTSIRSEADNAVLLDGELIISKSRLTSSGTRLAAAPDGSSVCVSGTGAFPAMLIHPPDMDTLVEKARLRTGGGLP